MPSSVYTVRCRGVPPRLYHLMKSNEYMLFVECIVSQVEWCSQYTTRGLSAGKFISVEPGRYGQMYMYVSPELKRLWKNLENRGVKVDLFHRHGYGEQ